MVKQGDLFNLKTIQRLCNDVKITSKQKQAAKEWLELLDSDKLGDEKSNYPKFMQIILQDILGYPIKELGFEIDNVEFQFGNSEGKKVLCFEAKGTSTKDIFASQHRAKKEHETPIKQTWDYMGSIGLDYGICTNYKDFVLITKQFGYSKYHFFEFGSIARNEERLKEFVGIFSKERIIEKGFVEKLHNQSVVEEREFTKEFYKLYHETRLMMIKAFQEKEQVSHSEAIYYTQMFLNRLIFIFFVEDRGFIPDKHLFSNRILHILELGQFTEYSKKIYEDIKELFIAFDKGSKVLGIFGFNGSLFSGMIPEKVYFYDLKDEKFFAEVKQNSKLLKSTKLNEQASKIIKKHPELNPIISNMLIMNSFDFNTEVNVNILGHIFEQSISDLEELKQENFSRRKREGVYYTPEYVTDYICRNTIIPCLSKSCVTSVDELIEEYKDSLEELENKFKEIKILDPACGSGAFLVKAVDILLEINKEIQNRKKDDQKSRGQLQITQEWDENKEVRTIVENNIYGVDINPESVEITRLSIFLKIASNERKLFSLTKNIQVGNSLIDDKEVDPKAFAWDKRFSEVLSPLIDDRGFDIVIGNPPYVKSRDQVISEDVKKCIEKNFVSAYSMWDLYVPFMELGLKLLKSEGHFAMIVKDTFGEVNYTRELIKIIEQNYFLYQIDFYPGIKIFENVGVENKIPFVKNTKTQGNTQRILHHPTISDVIHLDNVDDENKYLSKIAQFSINQENTCPLSDICFTSYGLRLNSDKNDSEFKFKKEDLISKNKSKIHNRVYTEGKYLEKFAITNELFVEWGTERCPKRLVRPTFPELYEPEKILMSRQKRIAAYSNQTHICDNTIIMGILAKDLEAVDNSNIKKYYKNLQTPRKKIEDNSKNFDLKYILAIINSNLIKYFLKYNSGGKIDSYPNDWKKIPIKKLAKIKQKQFVEISDRLIEFNAKFQSLRTKFLGRIQSEYNLEKIPKILNSFYEMDTKAFLFLLDKLSKKKISLKEKDEWEDYFEQYKLEIANTIDSLDQFEKELNIGIYKLYELNQDEIEIIECDITQKS